MYDDSDDCMREATERLKHGLKMADRLAYVCLSIIGIGVIVAFGILLWRCVQ